METIAAGRSATLAVTNAEGSWEPEEPPLRAERAADGVVLDGTAHFVQDARKATFFVVSAASREGVGLYAVPADDPGVTIRPDHIVDLTRDQARVTFDRVHVPAAAVVAPAPSGFEALRRATPAMLTIVTADIVGAADWQLRTTTEYAKVRNQFDRPLGFFQAVKHPIVNMMVAIDETRSLLYNAACAIDSEPELAERYARMAKSAAVGRGGVLLGPLRPAARWDRLHLGMRRADLLQAPEAFPDVSGRRDLPAREAGGAHLIQAGPAGDDPILPSRFTNRSPSQSLNRSSRRSIGRSSGRDLPPTNEGKTPVRGASRGTSPDRRRIFASRQAKTR